MARVYTTIVTSCGYRCPAYEHRDFEVGGAEQNWCTLYNKEIYGKIIKNGFPEFCKLPDESNSNGDYEDGIPDEDIIERLKKYIGT